MSTELHQLSVARLAAQLQGKHVSSVEAAGHFLARARAHQHLGAFLAIDEEATLAQARAQDALIAKGEGGPLAGVPIAHKDVFVTREFTTTAASRMLAGYRSPFDATIVERLAQAGCVTLGKLNCDEFAMGGASENSGVAPVGFDAPQPVRNPWDTARVPGGSSGGSSSAVAARLAPAATGSDTGGSIRQPAGFCGITGIKPTYGRASRHGMIAYASSLDQAGAMGRSAEDCALILSAMCGPDVMHDATSVDRPAEDYTKALGASLDGLRIGVPDEFFGDGLAPDVRAAIDAALAEYEKLGARRVAISLPRTHLAVPVYYILSPAEASSNLSRFDGVRYGYRSKATVDLESMYKKSRSEGFGKEVQRRIMLGTFVLSASYYDAYYTKAQKVRRMIRERTKEMLRQYDFILMPVTPTTAFKLGAHSSNPLEMYLGDLFSVQANVVGVPAISIPCGTDAAGLPIGLQVIADDFEESKLLHFSNVLTQLN